MISRDIAKHCVARLAGLPTYPKDNPLALTELIRAFETCRSLEHAETVVEGLLRECDFAPTPAAIHRTIRNTAPSEIGEPCKLCEGTGFREVERVHEGRKFSAAEFCACRQRPGAQNKHFAA